MDWVLLSLSSVFGRKCLVCVLEDFQCLFCRVAAASSLVLGDAYSII